MEDDAALVARAQDGDELAFAELVRRHRQRVFHVAVSVLGREWVPEAEDVAQEVFLKVHQGLGAFRGQSAFGSWVYRIAFNQAVNAKVRLRSRRPAADESALLAQPSREPGPHRRAEEAQRDQVLEGCIRTLPEAYQSALRLYYWLGLGVGEVAELLDVPENTAKSYLHRSRGLLKRMMEARGFDDA